MHNKCMELCGNLTLFCFLNYTQALELFSVVYGKDRHQLKLSSFYSKRCPSVEQYMTESDDDLEIRKDDYEIKKALFVTTFERLWVQRNSFTLLKNRTAHCKFLDQCCACFGGNFTNHLSAGHRTRRILSNDLFHYNCLSGTM